MPVFTAVVEAEADFNEELIAQQSDNQSLPEARGLPRPWWAPSRALAAAVALAGLVACMSVVSLRQHTAPASFRPPASSSIRDAVGLQAEVTPAEGENMLNVIDEEDGAPPRRAQSSEVQTVLDKLYQEMDTLARETDEFRNVLDSLGTDFKLCGKLICPKNGTCCGAAENGICCDEDATCCGSWRNPGGEICCGKGNACYNGACCAGDALQCGGICCGANDVCCGTETAGLCCAENSICCGNICGAPGSTCTNGVLS